jgi:hypothetical protein
MLVQAGFEISHPRLDPDQLPLLLCNNRQQRTKDVLHEPW